MTRTTALIALIALCAFPTHPARAGEAAGSPASAPTLLRTTLIVSDVDRALAFYRLLGFAAIDETAGPRDPAHNPFPLAAASHRSRLVVLESAGTTGGRIGLLSFDDPAPPMSRVRRGRVGRGDTVLVFEFDDADSLHQTLKRAGAHIVEPPQTFRSRQSDSAGRPWEGKVFHAFDPDGNLIELLQSAKPLD